MYINLWYVKIVFKVYLNFFVTKNIQTKTTKWTAFIWRNGDVSPPPGSNVSHRGLGCRIHHVFNISTMLWNYISRFVARYFWEPVRKSSEKAITSGLLFPKHQEKTITPLKRQTKMDWGEGRCAKDQTASICLVSSLSFVAGFLSLDITRTFSEEVRKMVCASLCDVQEHFWYLHIEWQWHTNLINIKSILVFLIVVTT